ncbi:MAG: hypothetical protein ACR2QK_19630, partial [Acidimicrobiales bacterium]
GRIGPMARTAVPAVIGVIVGVGLVVGSGSIAVAAAGWAGPAATEAAQPPPTVEVATPSPDMLSVSVRAGGGGAPTSHCSWRVVPLYMVQEGQLPVDAAFFAGHQLYDRHRCDDPGLDTYVWVPIDPVDTVLLPALSDYMEARLPPPDPVLTPIRPQGWVVVQLPLDFRTTADTWRPVVATASIDGPRPAFATATAGPAALEFLPGDPSRPGDSVACSGPHPTARYAPSRPGRCSYTYRNASSTARNGTSFPARLRTHWHVDYRSSDGTGTLAIGPTESVRPVVVAEIQALVSCIGVDCCSEPGL